MEIDEVKVDIFKSILPKPYHVFGTGDFSQLNAFKVEDVFYLLVKDKKYRLGITGGVRDASFYSPFSAPFGGFVFVDENIRASTMDEAFEAFMRWAKKKLLTSLHITLPPMFYNPNFISKQVNALYRHEFAISKMDLNHSFNLQKLDKSYTANIWRNARKNLRIAIDNQFHFKECETVEEKKRAYDIIDINRRTRGYPLRMSWEQILKTIEIIPSFFFMVRNKQAAAVASAIVFQVADKIVQVIYWGDLPEFSHLKTMNFLSYKVFEYFKNMKIIRIDIGPSTEHSIPNYGLCDFKESIGCDVDLKFTFQKAI